MEVTAIFPDPAGKPYLEFCFDDSGQAPRAVLSTRESGDMKYDPKGRNPNRESLLSSFGIDPVRVLSLSLAHSRNVLAVSGEADTRSFQERTSEAGRRMVSSFPVSFRASADSG